MMDSQQTLLTQGLDSSPPLAQHPSSCNISVGSVNHGRHEQLAALIDGAEASLPNTPPSCKRPRMQSEMLSLLTTDRNLNTSNRSVRTDVGYNRAAKENVSDIFKIPTMRSVAHKSIGALNHTFAGTPSKRCNALSKHSQSLSVSGPEGKLTYDRLPRSLPPFLPTFRSSTKIASNSVTSRTHTKSTVSFLEPSMDNTFHHHSELASGLLPAARSSALHESTTLSRSSDRSNASRSSIQTVLGKRSQAIFRTALETPDVATRPSPKGALMSNYSSSSSMNRFSKKLGGKVERPSNRVGSVESLNRGQAGDTSSTSRTNNNNPVEMEGDSELCKTIVCMIWQRGMLGACVYNTDTMKLHLVQDIPESSSFLSAYQLFTQSQPDVVITGAKQDSRFVETLNDMVVTSESQHHSCKLHTMPNEDLVAVGSVVVAGSPTGDWCQTVAAGEVRAAGGLLRYLEVNAVNLLVHNANGNEEAVPVLSVEVYCMQSLVWMDAHTYSSLRILHIADHPSTSLGNFYTREGFSLFGLMDRCKTSIGKKKLKELFLRPTRDVNVLNERLDCLEYFAPTKNTEVTQLISSNLSKLRNMSRIVSKMRTAALSSSDWMAMHRVLQSLIVITEICTQHKDDIAIFSKFPAYREGILSSGQILFDILDVEQTKLSKTFTIKPNYDAEMDTLVQRHRDLPQLLADRLSTHVKEVKQIVRSSVHIHYSSQLGCLLMIDITARMERTGDYGVDDLKLEFLTENNAYYSSDLTRDISEVHGDVKTAITDRALALMYQLQNTLLPDMDNMLQVLDLCSQLDCLIGLGSYCSEHNYVRPTLNDQDVINITGARHALLEAQVDHFISNDIVSGPGEHNSRVMIITGPNACGKSIYLKQTVLIVYLAHIGCLVPAQAANICLTDAIYTHFPNTDSINADVSTFTADLSRMAAIVSNASKNSLVILDEFGKGTSPVDGAALLLAFLKHWLDSGLGSCPHVLVTSHFHVICKSNWIKESRLASLKMMETHVEDGKLVYLYELVNGAVETSHAAAIAKLLEIPQECLLHGAQAKDEFGVSRQIAKANKEKVLKWKQSVVDKLLQLDLNDDESAEQFFDMVVTEQ